MKEAPFRPVQSKGALKKCFGLGLIWKPRFLGDVGLREVGGGPVDRGPSEVELWGVQASDLSRENGQGDGFSTRG